MATLALTAICDAIEATLAVCPSMTRAQSYDELTEGVHDFPLLQVYPESGETALPGETSRTTLSGHVRYGRYVIHADLYARQRAHIGEDMALLVGMIDEMEHILLGENKPFFDLDGIKEFSWSWSRVMFEYGDPMLPYMGARFVLIVHVF